MLLDIFGVACATLTVVCYWAEFYHSRYTFLFAMFCLASAGYLFLKGAWPFGIAEIIWAGIALRKWYLRRRRESLS